MRNNTTLLSKNLIPICRSAVGRWIFLNGLMYPAEKLFEFCDRSASVHANSTAATAPSIDEEAMVYEVVRCRNGRPCWVEQHAQRMFQSMTKFGYVSKEEGEDEGEKEATSKIASASSWTAAFSYVVSAIAKHNDLSEQNIKLVVWRSKEEGTIPVDAPSAAGAAAGADENGGNKISSFALDPPFPLPTSLQPAPPATKIASGPAAVSLAFNWVAFPIKSFYPPEEWYLRGTEVAVMSALRPDPHSKVPMPEMRARAEQIQREHGVFEVLLLRPSDNVLTEGSRSNFLLIQKIARNVDEEDEKSENSIPQQQQQYKIVQSPDDDVLLGITRETVNSICRAHNLPMEKRHITQRDIEDEATVAMALTGTSLGVLPVRSVVTFEDAGAKKRVKSFVGESGSVVPFLKELQRLYTAYRDGEMKF